MSKRVSNKKGARNQGARSRDKIGWRKRLARDRAILHSKKGDAK